MISTFQNCSKFEKQTNFGKLGNPNFTVYIPPLPQAPQPPHPPQPPQPPQSPTSKSVIPLAPKAVSADTPIPEMHPAT